MSQAPTKEPQQIDGGLVRPVDVLDDNDVQLWFEKPAQQCIEEFFAGGLSAAKLEQWATGLSRDVEQRSEGARSKETVARSPRPTRVRDVALELLHQRRFADAGLSGDEHQPALASPRLTRVLEKRRQRGLPFQQLHVHSVGRSYVPRHQP